MDLRNTVLFLSSTERASAELPVTCTVVSEPLQKTGDHVYDRGMVLVSTEHVMNLYGTDKLLLVPKHDGYPVSRLHTDEVVFVYVLDGTPYVDARTVELSEKQGDILDWGALTLTCESAQKWQAK